MSTKPDTTSTTDTGTPPTTGPAEGSDPQNTQEAAQTAPQTQEQPPGVQADPQTQLDALEAQNAALRLDVARAKAQARHGISDDDAALFLTGTDEDTLNRQAEALAAKNRPASGPHVASQGNHPTGGRPKDTDPIRSQLAERGMFGRP